MGKKMKLPLVLRSTETATSSSSSSSSSWPWVTCNNPKTLSFRATPDKVFRTMNTAYLNTPDCSSESSAGSFPSTSEEDNGDESIEAVIKGLRSSERLFFEPGETSSILEESANNKEGEGVSDNPLFKESVALAVDSRDPFLDFRRSMEEMVEAHGLMKKERWDCLEELLTCYLRVNSKSNHGYIFGAFVDLLVGLDEDEEFAIDISTAPAAAASACSSTSDQHHHYCSSTAPSFTSPLSFYYSSTNSSTTTTPCLSSSLEEATEDDEIIEKSIDSNPPPPSLSTSLSF